MIDIVKLVNGNVAIYDTATGDFIRSLSPDIVEIACNANGVVKVKQDNASVEYFDPADVNSTQVLPAAAVPFSGDCETLSELLATDFFFVTSGGISLPIDAVDVDYDNSTSGLTATDVQAAIDELAVNNIVPFYANSIWTSLQQDAKAVGSTNFGSNTALGVGFNLPVDTRIKNAKLEVTVSVGLTNCEFAIYEVSNGVITNRLYYQIYNAPGTGIYTFAVNLDLPAGNYAYVTQQAPIQGYRSITYPDNIFGVDSTIGGAPYITGKSAIIFTALPAVFPAQTNYLGSVPLVIFETEII